MPVNETTAMYGPPSMRIVVVGDEGVRIFSEISLISRMMS